MGFFSDHMQIAIEPSAGPTGLAADLATYSTATGLKTNSTTLLQDFTMPAAGADAVAQVGASSGFLNGQIIFLADIGWLEIVARG